MPQKELFEKIYTIADIFLYPTFSDTLGFAILEAQSFGLPVIVQKTRSTHTIHETVQNGKTGFIIENLSANANKQLFTEEIIDGIILKTEELITNSNLRDKMSHNCIREIKDEKFSIKNRNKILKRIYSEALK